MRQTQKLTNIYNLLLKSYGYRGWWPFTISKILEREKPELIQGYHPQNYSYPKTAEQQLEICLGAILTQNTNWNNVIPALIGLKNCGLFSINGLQKSEPDQIALAIKSAGYYNQKAKTIKRLVLFLKKYPFRLLNAMETPIVRANLLKIKGIGPETADCMLLYALNRCSFVVDAYTRRIFVAIGMVNENVGYDSLKNLFESSLKKDRFLFQEYHALLVQHGKLNYSRKPYGRDDRLLADFKS